MKIGSIVETVCNFNNVREIWKFPYPYKGDVLTVSSVTLHHNKSLAKKGIVLLTFEEIPNLPCVCDKQKDGTPNFVELTLPNDIYGLLSKPMKIKASKV